MKKLLPSLFALFTFVSAGPAADLSRALTTPFQVALVTPLQIFRSEDSTAGLQINVIYGRNENVWGVDLGLINHVSANMAGLQYGLVNIVGGNASGVLLSSFNRVLGNAIGWQSGTICNLVDGNAAGVQNSWILNNTKGIFRGFQFGLINIAEELHGAQLGLLNFNNASNYFSFFPILNLSF